MKYFSIKIIIEKEPEDEDYFAYSPTLPGCFSSGATIEETKTQMREAIELHLAWVLKYGTPIPQGEYIVPVRVIPPSEYIVHAEELRVGVPDAPA